MESAYYFSIYGTPEYFAAPQQFNTGSYWISTTLIIFFTAVSLIWHRARLSAFQRQSLWLALSSFAVLVLFLAFLSVAFDFGQCVYPSRDHPYFTSGRLMSAVAVPFFLCYSRALEGVLALIRPMWPRIILVAGIALFIAVSQFAINQPTFLSWYNFFHLKESG